MDAANAILALLAAGRAPLGAWLDGGTHGRGMFGIEPDEVIAGDDLSLLDEVEVMWRRDRSRVWMGWITYDLGARTLAGSSLPTTSLPGLCLRRYAGAVELRGEARQGVGHGDGKALADLKRALSRAPIPLAPRWPWGALRARISAEDHRARVERALEHVRAGDSYQVNIAQRFGADWLEPTAPCELATSVAAAYAQLRTRAPAPMGALVAGPQRSTWFLSNSPETLLELRHGGAEDGADVVRSWPIKGTRPRGGSVELDALMRCELAESAKDAAEHVMIVDLVRNDLGRVAMPGSVTAAASPTLVTLPTVHHLVTEVRAKMRPEVSLRELIEATFPGGSITGAPKRRSVELIAAIESEPRGIYCGGFVLLEPTGMRMSIAIRTASVDIDGIVVPAGGGIVADSDPETERLETISKTRAFDP